MLVTSIFSFSRNIFYLSLYFVLLSRRKIIILATFNLSSANASNLVTSKMLSFGNGLYLFLGHYIFIEASSPRRPGDNAILRSAALSPQPSTCLTFFYNMYGSDIGALRVWTQLTGASPVKVWELAGDQNIGWNKATVNVGQNSQYQVISLSAFFLKE